MQVHFPPLPSVWCSFHWLYWVIPPQFSSGSSLLFIYIDLCLQAPRSFNVSNRRNKMFKPSTSLITSVKKGRSAAKIHIISIIPCPLAVCATVTTASGENTSSSAESSDLEAADSLIQLNTVIHCLSTSSSSTFLLSHISQSVARTDPFYSSSPKQTAFFSLTGWRRLTSQDTSFLSCLSHDPPLSQFMKPRIKLQIYIFLHCGHISSSWKNKKNSLWKLNDKFLTVGCK